MGRRLGRAPVKTLHNTNGWAAGLVLLDFYRHDHTAEYLPLIDGIYNWTRHFVWTRNEFADVPSSPFAIGGTLSAAFLLNYHFAFRDDPLQRARAREAVELARKVTYRYMPIWTCDNDRDDNLDAAFLWEPNSGRDWTGTACANEVHWNLDTLTQVYVSCGDPILHYYLRGSLQRWHLLYKDIVADSLADYGSDALSEWLGLFDGTMAGRGGRASFGTGDILPLHYPVGALSSASPAAPRPPLTAARMGSIPTSTTIATLRTPTSPSPSAVPGRTPSTSRFPAPSGT